MSSEFNAREMADKVALASAQAVWEALTTDDHMGLVMTRYTRIKPRTWEGDAFEHAFEWARDKKKGLQRAPLSPLEPPSQS